MPKLRILMEDGRPQIAILIEINEFVSVLTQAFGSKFAAFESLLKNAINVAYNSTVGRKEDAR